MGRSQCEVSIRLRRATLSATDLNTHTSCLVIDMSSYVCLHGGGVHVCEGQILTLDIFLDCFPSYLSRHGLSTEITAPWLSFYSLLRAPHSPSQEPCGYM